MALIDVGAIRASTSLFALIESDLGPGKASGRRIQWPCPFHSDSDEDHGSMVFYPDQERFFCYGCRASGDVVTYLQKRTKKTFREVLEMLQSRSFSLPAKPAAPPITAPPIEWQEAVSRIIGDSVVSLWSRNGKPALDYLHGRGLTDETIARANLGYNRRRRELWELAKKDEDTPILPEGILIPCWQDGELWGVKTRVLGNPARFRYGQIPGSRAALYGDLTKPVALVCEGEIDALLCRQEAGDLVSVVTSTAGVGTWRSEWTLRLAVCRTVLVAFDNDQAGTDAAVRLLSVCQRARILKVPAGVKDLGEYHAEGGSIKKLVEGAL